MSNIHVNRAGNSLGQFSLEEIKAGLASGQFLESDLGWREGMAEWKKLGAWPEMAGGGTGLVPPGGPGAGFGPAQIPQDKPSWENRQALGFVPSLVASVREILLEPADTFARLKTSGGLGAPVFFYVLLGSLGGAVGLIFQMVFQMGAMTAEFEKAGLPAGAGMMGVGVVLVLLPLILVVVLFVSSAFYHLSLWLVGCREKTFESTLRIVGYAFGASAILQVVPFCGGMAAPIWGLVALVFGFMKTNNLTTGKAVIAALLPMLLCCGLAIAAGVAVPALAAASMAAGK